MENVFSVLAHLKLAVQGAYTYTVKDKAAVFLGPLISWTALGCWTIHQNGKSPLAMEICFRFCTSQRWMKATQCLYLLIVKTAEWVGLYTSQNHLSWFGGVSRGIIILKSGKITRAEHRRTNLLVLETLQTDTDPLCPADGSRHFDVLTYQWVNDTSEHLLSSYFFFTDWYQVCDAGSVFTGMLMQS